MGKDKSENYCVSCGKSATKFRVFGDAWTSYFFICNNCRKVWCVDCMGSITKKGARKTFRLGKKGSVMCPNCKSSIPMIYRPKQIPFSQVQSERPLLAHSADQQQQQQQNIVINVQQPQVQSSDNNLKYCSMCGKQIKQNAKFCEHCGGEQ